MLTVEKPTIDLGVLQYGKPHTFECLITNTLGKDMIINKVQVSCNSCTKATFVKKLEGNKEAPLKITFTPGSVGNQSKWVDVVYDSDQKLRIEFKAVVNG